MQTVEQQRLIPEERIIAPLVEVLNVVTPEPKTIPIPSEPITPTLLQSLDELFPEQQYDEKNIQKAKEIMGEAAQAFTPEQLKDEVIKIQYLCEAWLDAFEREAFDGLTLKELLHEKGGL